MTAQGSLDPMARLAGAVAHDFNNLLTGLVGQVSLARLAGGMGPEGLDQVEQITRRAAELCRQLATVAGRSSGGLTADVAGAVRAAVAAIALPPGVKLTADLAADLPAGAAEDSEVRLVVESLVRNAAESGADTIFVRAAREPSEAGPDNFAATFGQGASVWLEVRDNGPGIPEAVLARLGEPFLNVRQGGRGMGLALVLGVARGCRGEMRVSTRPASGTSVRVRLPAVKVPGGLESNERRLLVLVVDDQDTVRDIAGRLLESLGCDVVAARNGEEAIQLVRERPGAFHLALVDQTMPRLDGLATISELGRVAPSLPVVLMSGYAESDILPANDGRLAGYLQKPFRLPALREMLRRLAGELGEASDSTE